MPAIDLSILNQRQTPAFYADVFANRPAAGFVGRIFVSTNTFAFYRDNGTGWDLIGGPGTGTITGSGASGQIALWDGASTITGDTGLTYNGTDNSLTASKFIVTGGTSTQFLKGDGTLDSNTYNTGSGAASQVAFFSSTNAITGENNLWWDSVNNRLGINTNAPGTALDIHNNTNALIQLNQTTATNDTRIAFQNSGTALWRIGNYYNAGANDWGIFDVIGNIEPLSIKKTTGQTFIGAQTTSSGRLVVNDATGDNHIVVIGATAPSLRINNSGTGATKQIGIGLATATNNFIQGAVDRDMTIFNGSTTSSPILFGIYGTTNIQEAARISAARNFLINKTTDNGYNFQINGNIYATNSRLVIDGTSTNDYIQFYNSGSDRAHLYWNEGANSVTIGTYVAGGNIRFETNNNAFAMLLNSSGNLCLNTQSDLGYKLNVNGTGYFSSNLSSAGLIRLEPSAFGSIVVGSRSSQTDFQIYNTTNQFRIYNGTLDALTINTGNGNSQFNASLSALSIGVGNNISGFGDIMLISSNNANLYPRINRTSTSFEGGWKYSTGGVDTWYIGLRSADGVNSYHFYSYTTNTSVGQFTPSGNLLIGTTTDAGQKLQVNGTATATKFNTTEDIFTNIAAGGTSTIFTMADSQMYLVYITQGAAGSCVTFTSSVAEGGVTAIIGIISTSDSNILITASGLNVRATNNFGATVTMKTTIIRIK